MSEAPDDETVATLALAAGGRGNVRTETLRAFTEDEAKKLAAATLALCCRSFWVEPTADRRPWRVRVLAYGQRRARRQRGAVPRSQVTGSRLALAARRRAGRTSAARP